MQDLSFPIGRFEASSDRSDTARRARIRAISALPDLVARAVLGLGDAELDTPYRPGGWTVRQVVHHLADSHANAFIRLRLALTEDEPVIKPYDQAAWARLPDAGSAPVAASLALLEGLHARWAALLEALPPEAFSRVAVHPEVGPITVDWILDQYAWHGRHHVAHIKAARERNGW